MSNGRYTRDQRPIDPVPFDPWELVVAFSTTAWKVSKAVTEALDQLDDKVRGHANWRRDRQDLSTAMRETIDGL